VGQAAKKKLNAQELRFVEEYLLDSNAEAAAKRAGYAVTTARSKAHSWVGNSGQNPKPHVAAEISRRQEVVSAKTATEAERIRAEIAKLAFASKRNIMRVDSEGHPVIDLTETDDDALDAIAEIHTETVSERSGKKDEKGKPIMQEVRKVRVKLHDKLAALEKLARMNGMYQKEAEQQAGAVANAISDIQQRMSRAPIRRD
jgi:phage terminase small subunit